MRYPHNSWSILPAGQILFGKSKVTLDDIAREWGSGTVVVCLKPNGQFHFIAGSSGDYAKIGTIQDVHHDQTFARIGTWKVVNEIHYKLVDKTLELKFAVPPVDKVTHVAKAGLHVFK